MKWLKYYTLILFVTLLIGCRKDTDLTDKLVFDDDKQYYENFSPDLLLNLNDSVSIDVDNNGSVDVRLKINSTGIWIKTLNDDFTVSIGKLGGSGSGHVDTIAYNEIIDNLQSWHEGYSLSHYKIQYVGIKKRIDNTTYGWIKLEIIDESLILDEFYFRKEATTIIRAGIKNY